MKNIDKTIVYFLVACILIVIGFIYSNSNSSPETNPIKIGGIFSQTGVAAEFGEQSKNGALLAVEEINSNGGIDGRKVQINIEDDATDPKGALAAFKKLTSINNVDIVLGSNFDFVVNPLFAEAAKDGPVTITPSSPRIKGSMDTNKYGFTMLSDFSTIVYNLKNYLTKTPYEKAAVIHYQSAFGKEIFKVVDEISKENNKPETTEETYNSFGIKDWSVYILKMKKQNVEVVYFDGLGPDFIKFAQQSKQLGFNAQLITQHDIYSQLKGDNYEILNNVVVLNWDILSSNKIFAEKFMAKYGKKPEKSAAETYFSVYIAAKAVADAKGDKNKIPNILETTTFQSPLGTFRFDKNHAAENTNVKVQKIQNGKIMDLEIN